jgi:hypothetical protein
VTVETVTPDNDRAREARMPIMFPSFLDGATPTTPPELLEPVRDAPKPDVDQSFETHLQRTQDATQANQDNTEAKTADENPDGTVGDAVVDAEQSDADETNQEESKSVPEATDPAHVTGPHDDEAVSIEPLLTVELLTVDVAVSPQTDGVSEETPPEDSIQTEVVEPILEDETLAVVTFENVDDVEVATGSSDPTSSDEVTHDVPLSDRATTDEPEHNDVENPLEATSVSQKAVISERPAAEPNTTEVEVSVTAKLPSKGELQPGSSGETVERLQGERQPGNLETIKGGVV